MNEGRNIEDIIRDAIHQKIEEHQQKGNFNLNLNINKLNDKQYKGDIMSEIITKKNKMVAFLLAFFLGSFGVHWFYLNKNVRGVIYLIFSWTLIPTILSMFEMVYFLFFTDKEFNATYGGQ